MLDLEYERIEHDTFEHMRDGQRAFRNQRYKPKRKNLQGGIRRTLLDQPICAVDGEGKSRPDGSHHYTMLCATWTDAPTDRAKVESASLTFQQCMDFLLDLPADHTYVIYGGNYDTNMMLKYLPHDVQDRLLDTGTVGYKGYRLRWIERKFFSVTKGSQQRIVYDVLANFQVPFVRLTPVGKGACESWRIGTDVELDIIRRMKEQRGNFANVDDAAIGNYCYLECDLLRRLCRRFFDAILATPYRPRAVYGPGALAAAALEKHNVKRYMADLPAAVSAEHNGVTTPLTQYAYFGGRFDCSVLGWFTDIWQYDIKSAYPDQIRYLPCLAHATWTPYTYEHYRLAGLPKWGIFHVEWCIPDIAPWPPFPHRNAQGCVWYPYKGAGWYHAEEIRAAIELYGDAITFDHGWMLAPGCAHQPFAFVDALFEQRKRMPDDEGTVIKLVLNSLYGKCAQQVGGKRGKPPTFQCFYWAGAITAGTRAKLLRAIAQAPDAVYGVATDGLVCARELDLDIGGELGQWDVKQLASYAQVSNGVYKAVDMDGKDVERARGFGRANIDWTHVRQDYIRSRGVGTTTFMPKARFIGIREARARTDRSAVACTWQQTPRSLSFWPARRFPGKFSKAGPTLVLESVEPPDTYESQPFRLKPGRGETDAARAAWMPSAFDWQDHT